MSEIQNVNVKSVDLIELESIINGAITEIKESQEQATASFKNLEGNSELNFLPEVQQNYNNIVNNLTDSLEGFRRTCSSLTPIAEHVEKISRG